MYFVLVNGKIKIVYSIVKINLKETGSYDSFDIIRTCLMKYDVK
ncbi:hypothetical protein [Clostridium sp.]